VEFPLAPNPDPPRNAPPRAPHNSGELRGYAGIPEQGPIPAARRRELIKAYYAASRYRDAQLGKLLDALDRLDLANSTAVALWGDHGYRLGWGGVQERLQVPVAESVDEKLSVVDRREQFFILAPGAKKAASVRTESVAAHRRW
jgi:arylsulfatase A-like enzyme